MTKTVFEDDPFFTTAYVAGASMEIERCRDLGKKLTDLGVRITHPWWDEIDKARAAGVKTDQDLTIEAAFAAATADLTAVRDAVHTILLVPAPASHTKGAWGEFVAACALARWGRPQIVRCETTHVVGDRKTTIFLELADYQWVGHDGKSGEEQLLDYFVDLRRMYFNGGWAVFGSREEKNET